MTVTSEVPNQFYCSDCNTPVTEDDRVCPKCGVNLEEDVEVPIFFKTTLLYSEILSILGGIVILIGIIVIILSFSSTNYIQITIGIPLFIAGFLGIVNGQIVRCFIAIERNTRQTNKNLLIKFNELLKKIC